MVKWHGGTVIVGAEGSFFSDPLGGQMLGFVEAQRLSNAGGQAVAISTLLICHCR